MHNCITILPAYSHNYLSVLDLLKKNLSSPTWKKHNLWMMTLKARLQLHDLIQRISSTCLHVISDCIHMRRLTMTKIFAQQFLEIVNYFFYFRGAFLVHILRVVAILLLKVHLPNNQGATKECNQRTVDKPTFDHNHTADYVYRKGDSSSVLH